MIEGWPLGVPYLEEIVEFELTVPYGDNVTIFFDGRLELEGRFATGKSTIAASENIYLINDLTIADIDDDFNPWSTSMCFILIRALFLKTGGKAFTGIGSKQGTTFPFVGMGMPVGKVSPMELTNTKEDVSTPGMKVLSSSLFTCITVRFSFS